MKHNQHHIYYMVSFVVGAEVMVLEMVGSRILSPYFGGSINMWTILIGIILLSLSFGSWWGGILADRGTNKNSLSHIFCLSGIYIALVAVIKDFAMNAILGIPHINLLWGGIMASLLFFLIPNILLGMVNPYLAKYIITSLKSTGSHMGNLNAISTLGSIIGTFSASFLLIPVLGITAILFILALVLFILSAIVSPSRNQYLRLFSMGIVLCMIAIHSGFVSYARNAGLIEIGTSSGNMLIYQNKKSTYLVTGAFGYESSDSFSTYLPHFDSLISQLLVNPEKALVIGGGTFNLSNYLLRQYPKLQVESVEIEKEIKRLAHEYFGYKDNPRHTIIIEDGRTYINKENQDRYDLLINDAFRDIIPPYYLLTQEATEKTFNLLNPKGYYILNMATSLRGKQSWLLEKVYRTLSAVYPHVSIIPLEKNIDKGSIQSVLLIATKGSNRLSREFLARNGEIGPSFSTKNTSYILTDDYAPIEFNLMSTTFGQSPFHMSRKYLTQVIDLANSYCLKMYSELVKKSSFM